MNKFFIILLATCLFWPAVARAQLVIETPEAVVPATDPYTVSGIQIDMPISNAQAGRDEALFAAQRQAYENLKTNLPDTHLPSVTDSQLNKLMQTFEVAGEKISAKRYLGNFTIRFRPHMVQALATGQAPATSVGAGIPIGQAAVLTVTYRFRSLTDWTETERRLKAIPTIQSRAVKAMGRAYIVVELNYMGTPETLNQVLAAQNMELQQSTPTSADSMLLIRRDAV